MAPLGCNSMGHFKLLLAILLFQWVILQCCVRSTICGCPLLHVYSLTKFWTFHNHSWKHCFCHVSHTLYRTFYMYPFQRIATAISLTKDPGVCVFDHCLGWGTGWRRGRPWLRSIRVNFSILSGPIGGGEQCRRKLSLSLGWFGSGLGIFFGGILFQQGHWSLYVIQFEPPCVEEF